jgi:sugar fermentation stimulation protein A
MKFASSLIKGKLIQRYKRFLADVELEDGSIVTAHCANSGSMLGLKDPGFPVYLSPATGGKLLYRWEIVEVNGALVGINTSLPNKLTEEALINKLIPEFAAYESIRREVKYGESSRIDFLLESPGLPPCYLEVKSVITKRTTHAEFPDAVTARGTKHLIELSNMVKLGSRAAMLYVAMREDCDSFALAEDIDPIYAETSRLVFASGVEKYCYQCDVSLDEIRLARPLLFRQD